MPVATRTTPPKTAEAPLLHRTKQLELVIRSRLDELLRPAGLTSLQYAALTVVERQHNLTSAQLARAFFVTAQTMADLVATLSEHGLIERTRDADDRRRLVLGLTGHGRRLLGRYRSRVAAVEIEMLQGLSRDDVASLRRLLAACHANLAGRPPT